MIHLLALIAALADAGPSLPAPRPLQLENLGAAPVTLRLERTDGSVPWGPFELGPHEVVRMTYCPCANLTLELRAPRREKALRYALRDQSAILLSEDRWSEGDPIVRHATDAVSCGASTHCEGPDFHIGR